MSHEESTTLFLGGVNRLRVQPGTPSLISRAGPEGLVGENFTVRRHGVGYNFTPTHLHAWLVAGLGFFLLIEDCGGWIEDVAVLHNLTPP